MYYSPFHKCNNDSDSAFLSWALSANKVKFEITIIIHSVASGALNVNKVNFEITIIIHSVASGALSVNKVNFEIVAKNITKIFVLAKCFRLDPSLKWV